MTMTTQDFGNLTSVPATNDSMVAEANAVAYRTGLRELAPLALKVYKLEALMNGLVARIEALEKSL